MGAANLCCSISSSSSALTRSQQSRPQCRNITLMGNRDRKLSLRVKALNDIVSATPIADPFEAQLTWQILVGSIAGVVPFVVAGIEFTKRIATQRKCTVCKGTGLVQRDKKYYFRCPGCGGFLPWQSWKRFFSG